MKKVLTVILVLMISMTGFSQTIYKLDSLYQYQWNIGIPDWEHNITEKYTYENGGTKETYILGLMDNGPGFEDSYQSNKSYNTNNDIIEDIRQTWNPAITEWVDAQRQVYTYNTSDLLESETTEISNGMGGWMAFSKIIYTYYPSGNLKDETQQEFSFTTMMLQNSTRIVIGYNMEMLADLQTDQEWNSAMGIWENIEKAEIDYTDGVPTYAEYSEWNSGLMDWDPPYERDTATYDDVSGLTTEVFSEDFVMGLWVNSDLLTFTYTNGLLTELLEQVWDGAVWVDAARELKTYDTEGNNTQIIFDNWDGAAWVGFFKQDRFYSPAGALGVDEFGLDVAKAYPNPVRDELNIKLANPILRRTSLSIISMDGKLIKTSVLEAGQKKMTLNLKDLSQGIYMLRFNGQTNQAIRVIKQ